MAIVPLLLNLARELDNEYDSMGELDHMLDDDFGFGIHPVDLFRPRMARSSLLMPRIRRRFAPYERILKRIGQRQGGEAAMVPTVTKDGFYQVCMDVSQFKPNELTVKTIDNCIVVEGNHEEREDGHGLIQRHFVRKYNLPKGFESQSVVSTISSDGILTVKAPPPPNKAITQNERIVQIQQTGPAHLSVKAPEKLKDSQNGTANESPEAGK